MTDTDKKPGNEKPMELMDRILQDDCWNDFLAHKTAQNNMPAGELAALKRFVEEKQYVMLLSHNTYVDIHTSLTIPTM